MKKEDIKHLAHLSRIAISDTEADAFAESITEILGYVGEIQKITGERAPTKEVGVLYNVMREDGEAHEGGLYTEDLLSAAPERDGHYVAVKKIITNKS